MSNPFLAKLAAGLARVGPSIQVVGPRTRATLRVDIPSLAQPLAPAIPWDWHSPGPGQISLERFNLYDTQPASCEAAAPFVSGTASFSEAYQAFLGLVAPSFTPASM